MLNFELGLHPIKRNTIEIRAKGNNGVYVLEFLYGIEEVGNTWRSSFIDDWGESTIGYGTLQEAIKAAEDHHAKNSGN